MPATLNPFEPASMVQAQVAVAAQVKVLQVQKQMGQAVLQLLDPNVGTRLNASA